MAKHFIQRVVIDLHDDDRAHAVTLQNDMSALFRSKLQARLEAILNEYDRPGTTIRLDRLDVDLGHLQRQHLERDVLRRFDDALRLALQQAIPPTTAAAPAQGTSVALPSAQQELYALTYYLQHGRLPADAPQQLEINALLQQVIQSHPQLAKQHIQPLLRDRNAIYRIAYTLHRNTLSALLQLLAPQTHERLMLALDNILSTHDYAPSSSARLQLQRRIFHAYFSTLQQSLLTRQSLNLTNQELQPVLTPFLPRPWQTAAPHLFTRAFALQNPTLPDAATLARQSQTALIDALKDADTRYRLLEQNTADELAPILQKLAGSKAKSLNKRIQSLIDDWNIPSAYRNQLKTHAWSLTLLYLTDRAQAAKLKLSELEAYLTEELTQFSRFVRWRSEQQPTAQTTTTDWSILPSSDTPLPAELMTLDTALQQSLLPTSQTANLAQALPRLLQQQLQQWLSAAPTDATALPTALPPSLVHDLLSLPFGEWMMAQLTQWIASLQNAAPTLAPSAPNAAAQTNFPTTEAAAPASDGQAIDPAQINFPTTEADAAASDGQATDPAQVNLPTTEADAAASDEQAFDPAQTNFPTTEADAAASDEQAADPADPSFADLPDGHATTPTQPPFSAQWWEVVEAAPMSSPPFAERPVQAIAQLLAPLQAALAQWLTDAATSPIAPPSADATTDAPAVSPAAAPPAPISRAQSSHQLTQALAQAWAVLIPPTYGASPTPIRQTLRALGTALHTALDTAPDTEIDLTPVRDWLSTLRLQTREMPESERWFQVLAAFAERLEQTLDTWTAMTAIAPDAPRWTADELLALIQQAQATVYAQARPWQQSTWADAIEPLITALQKVDQQPTALDDPSIQQHLQAARNAVVALLQALPSPTDTTRNASTSQERQLALSALEVIEQFLRRGYVSEQLPDINAVLAFVQSHEPERLRNLLQRIGREGRVQQRLRYELAPDTQRRLIELLAPAALADWAWAQQLPGSAYDQWTSAALYSWVAFRRIDAPWVLSVWMEQQADEVSALQQVQALLPPDDRALALQVDWIEATQVAPEQAFESWASAQAMAYLRQGVQYGQWESPLPQAWIQAGIDHALAATPHLTDWAALHLHDQPAQRLDQLVLALTEGQRNRLLHVFFPEMVGFLATLILALQDQMEATQAWQAVIRAAFHQPKADMHTGRLIAGSIRHAAQLQRRRTQEVTTALLATAQAQAQDNPRFKPLLQLLRHLPKPLAPFADKAALPPPPPPAQPERQWQSVLAYLRHGQPASTQVSVPQLTEWVQAGSREAVDYWRVSLRRLYRERTRHWQQQLDLDPDLVLALTHQLQPLAKRDWAGYLHDLSLHLDNTTLQAAILQRIADLPHWESAAQLAERVAQTVVQAIAQAQKRSVQSVWEEWETSLRQSATRSNLAKIVTRQRLHLDRQPPEPVENTPEPPPPAPRQAIKIDTTIYTEQAGIILLWVFFPHLYTMLELTENRAFKDAQSAHKALHLLYYTATGQGNPQEFQLALEKLLCSLPLEQPIPTTIELADSDREACDQLVQAALNRWQKLKNTSVVGFRASFLKRSGRLTKTAKGWSLTVEQKPFDMLLKSLPWGIAIVRFPWMEEPIYIDWV